MKRILVFVALLIAWGAAPVSAEPNDGTVTGSLVNKTAGGQTPAGSTVTLVLFGRKESAPVGQKTTQADDQGHYSFTGLDRDANLVYITLARYQNVNYPTDAPFQLVDKPSVQADISVYETTSSDDAIQLERLNLLVLGADQGLVQFMQMGSLVNAGDRTFVTANPQDQALARGIRFALPPGALSVQMQQGFSNQDMTTGVGGVQVTSPVLPGKHEFALSFQLPYSGSDADVSLQVPYATSTYNVYVPGDAGLKLNTGALQAAGPAQLGGQTYSLYTTSNVPKQTVIGAQLGGLGATSGLGASQLAMISLGVVLLVLGGGVLAFGARRRPVVARGEAPAEPEAGTDPQHERLELVVRLAALDERYAAGEVSEQDYVSERERGKKRLRELSRTRHQAAPTRV